MVAVEPSFWSAGAGLVAYFNFTNLQSDSHVGGAAFRAVIAQMLQARRSDPDFIDIASLLHDNGKGQNKALEQDILDIIRLFLKCQGPSFGVFDRLDECSDVEDLFLKFNDVPLKSSCKILILTRPIMDISGFIDHQRFHRVTLQNQKNSGDIEIYLRMRCGWVS